MERHIYDNGKIENDFKYFAVWKFSPTVKCSGMNIAWF